MKILRKTKKIEGKKWKEMRPDAVRAKIDDKSRIQCYDSNRTYYKSKLDRGEFLSLIWHEIDASRLLTPWKKSRMIQDVAGRVVTEKHTFQLLSTNLGLTCDLHDPIWFRPCYKIDSEFDYDRFGIIWLVLANKGERDQSPPGTYYIYDGCHRSLVLGKRLLEGEEYHSVKAILICPRPD